MPRHARADRRPGPHVRWDRLGRTAMLCVLVALLYLYLSAGVHMFSTWRQAHRDTAAVSVMQREHRKLLAQHETLGRQETVEAEARQLGMRKRGEQSYDVGNLPDN
jgi:hypothetical protein